MMDDELLKEVDEAVRQEKLHSFWNRFGNYIIAASVAIVVITVAVTLWRNHTAEINAQATATLLAAEKLQQAGEYTEAAQLLSQFPHEHKTLKNLAKMREMLLWQQAGDKQKALAAAQDVMDSTDADAAFRDFAAMLVAVTTQTADSLGGAEKSGRAFTATAREIKASLLAAQGRNKKAALLFRELNQDATTPDGMRLRTRMLLTAFTEGNEVNGSADD